MRRTTTQSVLTALLLLFLMMGGCATNQAYRQQQNEGPVVFEFGSYAKTGDEPTVVVVPFTNQSMLDFDRLGESVSSVFSTALIKSNRANVISRQAIDAITQEMKLQLSGMTSSTDAIELGKLANAELLITGAVTEYSVKSEKRGAGIAAIGGGGVGGGGNVSTQHGTARMTVDVQVIDVSTSQIVFADTMVGEQYTRDIQGGMAAFVAFRGGAGVTAGSETDFGSTLVGQATRRAVYNGLNKMIASNALASN